MEVGEWHVFHNVSDLVALRPSTLVEPFTSAELAQALGLQRRLAQQMTYCLRQADGLLEMPKRGRARQYQRR